MANTYTLIASSTVGSGGAANIEFTSIPGTYTDLSLFVSARCTPSNIARPLILTFNSNTSNKSSIVLYGSGATAVSSAYATEIYMIEPIPAANSTASTFSNISIYIPNYASSNNKSASMDGVSENNATTAYAGFSAGLWANSAAITTVKVQPETGNFVQHSTAYLYGISNS